MRTSSLVAAVLAASCSVAFAEQEMPKIYFPRHIKRHFINATVTQTNPHTPPPQVTGSGEELKRRTGGLLGLLDGLIDNPDAADAATSANDVTTVITDKTIYVSPPMATGQPGTGSSSSSDNPTPTPSTSSDGGLLGGLGLGGLGLGGSLPSQSSPSIYRTGILLLPTTAITGTPTSTSTASDGGLLGGLGTAVGGLLGPSANLTNSTATETGGTATASSTSSGGGFLGITVPPLRSTSSISVPTNATTGPNSAPTIPANSTVMATSSGTTSRPTGSTTGVGNSTTLPTGLPSSVHLNSTTVSVPMNLTVAVSTTSSTVSVTATTPTETASVSSTDSATATSSGVAWLPTTIVVAPSPTSTPSTPGSSPTGTSAAPTGIPTGLPTVITPEGNDSSVPDDMTLIQIGFKYPLNYQFVASNSYAASQIVQLMPQGLAYQGGYPAAESVVHSLTPLDTQSELGFITTLVLVTYPTDLIDQLQLDIRIPTSALYMNPDALVANMTQNINPAIPITLGAGLPGSGASTGATSDGSDGGNNNNDAFGNGNTSSDESPTQKGTTAGIAVGAVAAASAYGAAMFLIARRYKRKKQLSHRRASSITNASDMRQTGSPALMGGALLSRDFTTYGGVAGGRESHGSGRSGAGNSARTATISAPLATENSLGWN